MGNEEEMVGDYATSPRKSADPVVYQLVRVDDSGRLVPATDDEVITVEDLLGSDKTQGRIVLKTEQTPGCRTKYECGSDSVQFKGSEIIAGIASVSPDRLDSEKTDARHRETSPLTSTAGSLGQSGCQERCSKLPHQSESSHTATDTSSKPDFSLLKGEIRLNDLSVRDLQETFRATFGRETSVKDKQWLKRRIIMGLTNSCDFSITTLVVTEHEVVNKCKEDTFEITDKKVLTDSLIESNELNDIHSNANVMKIENSTIQDNSASKDSHADGRPAKRVRKPTRRYIEESSEGDTAGDQPTTVLSTRPIYNTRLEAAFVTRKDTIGGSGVEVPYLSRIRRSRPRESFATLSKFQKIGLDMSPTRLMKNDSDVESSKQHGNGSGNKVYGANSSPREIQDPPVTFPERGKLYEEQKAVNLENEMELESMKSSKNSSDEEMVTFPTANGGMRRKHHRPWAINEVVKLVEGVAKYGVGRWSEIKRLAFASYSYRTPVDLKAFYKLIGEVEDECKGEFDDEINLDKWRNLLRASVAEVPGRNPTETSRKQASLPIPAPILSRVRELADIHQAPTPVSLSSSKLTGYNNSTTNLQAGFL